MAINIYYGITHLSRRVQWPVGLPLGAHLGVTVAAVGAGPTPTPVGAQSALATSVLRRRKLAQL